MKYHITNLYNFNSGDELVHRQHKVANVARDLDFLEMGIFSYPVETDSNSELHKRMDGIIASLESEDVVIFQLPTENGYEYENLLVNKIKAYRDSKIIFLLHDLHHFMDIDADQLQDNYANLFRMADALILPTAKDLGYFKDYPQNKILFLDDVKLANIFLEEKQVSEGLYTLCEKDFYLKKVLIDALAIVDKSEVTVDLTDKHIVNEYIHVGFGLHDQFGTYSVWVGCVMQSIVENTKSLVCFHIMHDDTLTAMNRERLREVAERSGHVICFHYIDKAVFMDNTDQLRHYTIGAMFRVILPELLLELPKIIYLDADLYVNRDIKELWDVDISDYLLAAVKDPDSCYNNMVIQGRVDVEQYFNSGVLYLNLDRIRQNGDMKAQVLEFLANNPNAALPDQDALNVLYSKDTLILDKSWNYYVGGSRINKEQSFEKRIYHYAGTKIFLYYNVEIDRQYYNLIGRTPWGEEICPWVMDRSMGRITDRIEQRCKALQKTYRKEIRQIYYGKETNGVTNLYKLFPPKDGDYRVLENAESNPTDILPCKALSEIKNEKLPYVVFVLAEADDGKGIAKLEQMGLKHEEDFFVIQRLLVSEQGGFV